MTSPRRSLDAIAKASHRTTLAVLALCAGVIALQSESGSDSPPPLDFTITALALGLGTIVARQFSTSAVMRPQVRMPLVLLAHVCAGLIGGVAVALAMMHGERQNALLFTLGAAILSLRPPTRMEEPTG